jgi:hypothetical protein
MMGILSPNNSQKWGVDPPFEAMEGSNSRYRAAGGGGRSPMLHRRGTFGPVIRAHAVAAWIGGEERDGAPPISFVRYIRQNTTYTRTGANSHDTK